MQRFDARRWLLAMVGGLVCASCAAIPLEAIGSGPLAAMAAPAGASPAHRPTAPAIRPTRRPLIPQAMPVADAVARVLELCNIERAKVGAAPLGTTAVLTACAQGRADDMVSKHYFSHHDPDGHDATWWLRGARLPFSSCGENIAYGQETPELVVDEWMHSAGHRANILRASFSQLGVGRANDDNNTTHWVQVFTGP
jgi:uncharacterized protein YkwD